MPRVLYRTAAGSWRETRSREGLHHVYSLMPGETWSVLPRGRVLVVRRDRRPKVLYASGRVEEITGRPRAIELR